MVASDGVADASGAQNERDIVGDVANPAAMFYTSSTYLFIRLRLEGTAAVSNGGGAPLAPFGWGFAFDTNSSFAGTGYEYAWIVNGISEEVNFYRFAGGATGKVATYTPTVASPGFVKTSTATTTFGGDADGCSKRD